VEKVEESIVEFLLGLEDLLGLVEHLMALKTLYLHICFNLKSLPPCLEKLKSLK
jgi:hypothetical protein